MSKIKYQRFNFLTESLEDVYITDQPELVMKTTNNGTEYDSFSSLINSGITSFPARDWYVGNREKYATGLLIRKASYTSGDSGFHVSIWPTNPDQYYKTVSQINGDTNKIKIKVNVRGLVSYLEQKYGEDQINYSDPATTIFRTESMYAWVSGIEIHKFNNPPQSYKWYEDSETHISSWVVDPSRVIRDTIQGVTISIKDLKSNTVIERNYVPQGVSGDNTYQENVFVICTILLCTDFNPNYTAYDYSNSYVRYINNNGSVVQKDENDELIYSGNTGRLAYPLFNVYEGNEHLLYDNNFSKVYITSLSESYADRVLDNVYGPYGISPESGYSLNGGQITYIDINGNTQTKATTGEGFILHNMDTLPISYNDSTYTMYISNAIVDYDEVEPEPGEEGKYVIQIKFKNDSAYTDTRPATVSVQGWIELSDAHIINIDKVYNITSSVITDEIDLGENITVSDYNIEFEIIDGYTLESNINETVASATYTLEIPQPEDVDPEVNYPDKPEDVQNTPTPETPQDTSDLLEALKGYIDGQLANGNFDDEDHKASDTTNGTNGLSLGVINSTHYTDFNVYVLNRHEAYEMQKLVAHMVTGDIGEMLLCFNKNFSPQDVIIRVLELPFAKRYIDSLLDSTKDTMPAYNDVGLCYEATQVDVDDFIRAKAKFLGGLADDFVDFLNDIGALTSGKLYFPGHGTPHLYQQTMNRFVEIDYKSVTVKRIFGNYLDYTDVKYKILLPQGEIVNIDPNLLFRGSNSSLRDESIVSIKGILDLESGVMLVTIYINDDMFYQTSLDMGVERSLYGKSDINALRGIMKAVTSTAQLAALGSSMAYKGSIFANTKAWPSSETVIQTKGKANIYGPNGEIKSSLNYNDDPITRTTTRTEYSAAAGRVPGTIGGFIGAYNDMQGNYVEFSQGKPSEEAKLIANQIPQFIYEYPEIMIPKQGPYSNPGPWDYTFNYFDEVGMSSATTKIGKGFNQFGTITNIDLNWSYSWSHEELKGYKESLLNGFYIHDEDHIYRSPGQVYTELFDNPDRYIYSPEEPGYIQGQGMSQGYECTNSIVLVNVFSNWEKYIDRFHPDNLIYSIQGGNYYICYECTPYRDMNIDNPIIDISSEIYTHQNTAIWNGRIYRVVNVDYMPGHIVRLYLQEDYITTWYYFGVVEGIITRSSSYGIGDMADSYPKTVRRIVKKDNFLTSYDISQMFDGTDIIPNTVLHNGSTYIVVTAYDSVTPVSS